MDVFIDGEALSNRLGLKRPYIERCLGLPQRSLSDKKFLKLPETQALLKLIITFPWLIEVAENGFNPEKKDLILCREYFNLRIRNG